MDDNELDRLFGEVSESVSKPEKEPSKDKEKEPSDKEVSDSERAEEVLRKNGFIISKYKESSENEEDSDEDASDDEDKEESEESEESGENEDSEASEEEGEESEDEENGEDGDSEEESDEESEEGSDEDEEESEEEKPEKKAKKKPRKPHRRLNARGITIICLFVLIIGLVALIWFLPAFRVRNVHVEGNVSQSDQEILRQLKLEYNAHLMGGVSGNILDVIRLDYGKTEERIKRENPYIEDIRVSIKLPSTVDVTVKERSKICYIRTPDGYAALDKDGIVLELSSKDNTKNVRPVICGLNVKYAELGKPVTIGNSNDYKKAIIVLGAILAADNASIGDSYSMFENTLEVRMLPSGYIFLTVKSPSGKLIQIKLNSLEKISDKMAWLLYAFNSEALDKTKTKGFLDMTGDDPTLREY
ncbi:MAG: FtsQ-type POTRA domain-containing protein [Clostridiales bacterium]|nr:FtsQ-type POTRA domain-containing protein [Clostridiales bacterium]